MLSSLQRLQKLISRPAHSYRPTAETFADLDVQRLASETDLVAKGKKLGKDNQPATEGAALDSVETEVVELVGAAQKRAHDQLENHLAGFRQRLIDLDFEARFAGIKTASAGGLSDLKAELQIGIDELHGLRRDLTEAESWQSSFRSKNRLERPSRITTSTGAVFKWLIIVAIVLVELVVNGELLSKGSELGLIGGIFEALIFAALNVGVALMFALYAVPLITHRSFFAKIIGLTSLAAYLACMVAINLGLAHYREVAGVLTEGAGQEVMKRLIETPLVLTDFKSWLLFGLGVLFSLIAFIDGLNMRDTYPGYARVNKGLRTARDKYTQTRSELITQLNDVRSDYEDELASARADLSKQRTEHDSIVAHRLRMVSLFHEHQSQLERAANALLRAYRDANAAARTTAAPARFSEPYQLPRIEVQLIREGEWNSEELKKEIREAQTDLDALMRQLGEQFEFALAKYRELDILAPDK